MKANSRDFALQTSLVLVFSLLLLFLSIFSAGSSTEASDAAAPKVREQDALSLLIVQADFPENVGIGERFLVELTLENQSKENVNVEKIQFPACFDLYLSSVDSSPEFARSLLEGDALNYYFDGDVEVLFSSEKTLSFEFLAEAPGPCEGEILVFAADETLKTEIALSVDAVLGEPFLPQGEILFEDDFSTTMNTWWPHWDDYFTSYRFQGHYVIDVDAKGLAALELDSYDFPNVSLGAELETRKTDNASGYYGLLCRYSSPRRYYAFALSLDGQYAIWKLNYGEKVMLEDWQPIPVPLGEKMDTLTLSCIEDELLMAINDTWVAKVTDPDPLPERGMIALLVSATGKQGFTVAFDNVIVRAP